MGKINNENKTINPAEQAREKVSELFRLLPDEFGALAKPDSSDFSKSDNDREIQVYANSLESNLAGGALVRILSEHFGRQRAYFRSEKGGMLSPEESRQKAYLEAFDEEEAIDTLNRLLTGSRELISFADLHNVHRDSPRVAENLWQMLKSEARMEFENGNRAAVMFECADYMTDAWNRAGYIGIRESFCEEWQPKGGIELSMIDMMAQSYLQFQFWTQESIKRATTKPREENFEFSQWKRLRKVASEKQWDNGKWDIPYLSEQSAINEAAQLADRWQKMYFRAIRSLRDWRRYTPQVTINNPQQVNIAANGGQQINQTEKSMS